MEVVNYALNCILDSFPKPDLFQKKVSSRGKSYIYNKVVVHTLCCLQVIWENLPANTYIQVKLFLSVVVVIVVKEGGLKIQYRRLSSLS